MKYVSLIFFLLILSTGGNAACDRGALLQKGAFDDLLQDMTLEEKVGQLFFSFFYGDHLSPEILEMLDSGHLGNIMYYGWANTLTSKETVGRLSREVQGYMVKNRGIPALIAVDQEGGSVFRLAGEFIQYPGNMALAATQDANLAYEVAFSQGSEMRTAGIGLNFAPVVDCNSEPSNPVIGVRSFSQDPFRVVTFAQAMIRGYHDAGVLVTLKHFPGHGDTRINSHYELPTLLRSKQELEERELIPFRRLCHESDALMTAHILVPSLDPFHCVTSSKLCLQELLRQEIGYKGLVISDSLVMKGIVSRQSTFNEAAEGVARAAISSLCAGCDCLILGRLEWADFPEKVVPKTNALLTKFVLSEVCKAVRQGVVSQGQLDASVKRVLLLKQKSLTKSVKRELQSASKLAEIVAKKSLTLLSPLELFDRVDTSFMNKNVLVVAPRCLEEAVCLAAAEYPSVSKYFITNELLLKELVHRADQADLVIFLSYKGSEYIRMSLLAKSISCRKLIFCGVGDPYELMRSGLEKTHLVYLTYCPLALSIKAFLRSLDQHAKPAGVLPIFRIITRADNECEDQGLLIKKPESPINQDIF